MKRRDFIKASLATAALSSLSTAAAEANTNQEYYELRVYRLKPESDPKALHSYLEKAALPAWNRVGSKSVGVFTEPEPKQGPAVYVLAPYPTLDAFSKAANALRSDRDMQKAGAEYLQTSKSNPGFVRIDSWFMLAFAGIPKLELPSYSREKRDRIFELRIYESYSEVKALKKIDMFNDGEIDIMREVGLAPIFFGQALIGQSLPHLTYMLSAENRDAHKQHWDAFGKHPNWKKMSSDPQYADTVSAIRNHFLVPTAYSQI
jgi:hypothetical protein